MIPEKETMPYREGAIGIVLDSADRVLIVQMHNYSGHEWRMPGGGVEEGESPEEAIVRELKEELGISEFSVLGKGSEMNQYDWDDQKVESSLARRGKYYRGQSQHQFVVRLNVDPDSLKIDEHEIKQFRWVNQSELHQFLVFPGQLEITKRALDEVLNGEQL